jgi:hypothetical protein
MSINTEVGGATANSYISVLDANTYFNYKHNVDQWNNLSSATNATAANTQKEGLLRQATAEIDNEFRFFEDKYYTGQLGDTANYQALEFPRTSNIDATNTVYIPQIVKDATCEQAIYILERTSPRRTEEGVVINLPTMSKLTNEFLYKWRNRQVKAV